MSASGDSRLYSRHQLCSGSTTDSVPSFLSRVGISGGFSSFANAPSAMQQPTRTMNDAAILRFVVTTDISAPPLSEVQTLPRLGKNEVGILSTPSGSLVCRSE